ncbi:hypothetical protein BGC_62800 [Burkholderia sp. 3C]
MEYAFEIALAVRFEVDPMRLSNESGTSTRLSKTANINVLFHTYQSLLTSPWATGAEAKRTAGVSRQLVPQHCAEVKFVSHFPQAFVTRPDDDTRFQTRRGQ